jgi:hypothetical protein
VSSTDHRRSQRSADDLTPGTGEHLATFRSTAGLYSLSYPAEWTVEADENIVNLLPADRAKALTASGYVGPGMIPREMLQHFVHSLPHIDPVTEPVDTVGSGWRGLRQSFVDRVASPPVFLDALVACNEHGFVLLTWNQPAENAPVAAEYEPVFCSLTMAKPREPNQRAT